MKKATIILMTSALMALCAGQAFAQSPIYVGVQGGISIPNLHSGSDNEVTEGYSSRLGPYFGVFGQYKFSDLFSIQPEVNYSSQGGKKNGQQAVPGNEYNPQVPAGTNFYANFKSVAKLNYIEVPVLAKFTFRLSDHFNLALDAGPYVGFLVGAKNHTSGTSSVYADKEETQVLVPDVSFDGTTDIKDQLRKANFGAQGGVELEALLGKGYLFVHAGGNYGFVNIQKVYGKNNTGAATAVLGYALQVR